MAAGSIETSIDCRGPAEHVRRRFQRRRWWHCSPRACHHSSPALHDYHNRLHAPVLGTAFSRAGAREIFVELDDGAFVLSVRGPRLTGRDKHDDERFLSNGVRAGELDGNAPAILKAQCKAAELAHRITKPPRCFNVINRSRVKIMQRRLDQAESSSQM